MSIPAWSQEAGVEAALAAKQSIDAGELGDLYHVHGTVQLYLANGPADRRGVRTVLLGPEHPYDEAFSPVAGCGIGFGDINAIEVCGLLNAIATDAPLSPDVRAGWKVQQTIDAILRSAEEARWVTIAEEEP
jgi:predicted dehydrogenase